MRAVLYILTVLIALTESSSWAAKSNRQKVIDFDDEMIEGMNKRPLDSVSQLAERDKRKRKPHLYKKRAGFRTETAEKLVEVRYAQ